MGNEYGLITAEYQEIRVNDALVPTIVLVGREKDTLRKVMYRTRVYPYVHVEEELFRNKKPNHVLRSLGVVKEEYSSVRTPWGKALRKLYLRKPVNAKAVSTFMRKTKTGNMLYGLNLVSPTKMPLFWLLESGVKSGWKFEDGKIVPVDVDIPLRKWMIDIEAETTLLDSVNPNRPDKIIMFTFWDSYDDVYVTVHTHERSFKPLLKNHKVLRMKDEKALLEFLNKCLDETYNPDLIAAHNLYGYDLVKWASRLDAHRLGQKCLSPKPLRRVDRRRFPPRIKGRIVCDILELVKEYTSGELESYSLEHLIEKFGLSVPKVPFYDSVNNLWKDETEIELSDIEPEIRKYFEDAGIMEDEFRPSYIVLLRNLLDVIAIRECDEKFRLIDFYDGLRKDFGGIFEDMIVHNQIIETGILRMLHDKIALPGSRPRKVSGGYKGAFIFEPEPGEYSNVAVMDFKREYPNIIRSLNVSPDTHVPLPIEYIGMEKEWAEKMKAKGYHVIYYESEDGAPQVYVFKPKPKGIIPMWVDHAFAMRDKWEKLEKKAIERGDDERAEVCAMGALRAKICANAAYGWMSYKAASLYSLECSAATALAGFLASSKLRSLIEELGYKSIYSHTDSAFYQLKPGEDEKDIERMANTINKLMGEWVKKEWNVKTSPFIIEPKCIYETFLILSKNYYGGKYIWDVKRGRTIGYDFKGSEIVRSDSSWLEKYVTKTLFEMILDGRKHEIKGFWAKIRSRLERRDFTLSEVGYPSAIKKTLGTARVKGKTLVYPQGYKGVPAHIKAVAYSNTYLGMSFRQGDKPKRIPINFGRIHGYPKVVDVYHKGVVKSYKAKDIAYDEHYPLPQQFIDAVDWNRIKNRLANKVDGIVSCVRGIHSKDRELLSFC